VPDITVKLAAGEGTTAHPVIREKDLEGHLENDQGDEKESDKEDKAIIAPVSEEEDEQLQRAIDLLKMWTIFKDVAEEPEQEEPQEDEPEDVPVNP
jgi:carboxyl-terminal processing protease